MIFGIVAAIVLLVIVLVIVVGFFSSIEKTLSECAYLKGCKLKQRCSIAKGLEFYMQIEFARWLSEGEMHKLNFVADLYGAVVEQELVASLYDYNNQMLTFVFRDFGKAEEALGYFKEHCHAIVD